MTLEQLQEKMTTLEAKVASQQDQIESYKDTIVNELVDNSRFFGSAMTGMAADVVDAFLILLLSIAFTYIATFLMTKVQGIQKMNVPNHDEFEMAVDKWREERQDKSWSFSNVDAMMAQALSRSNQTRIIAAIVILVSMYAYLS